MSCYISNGYSLDCRNASLGGVKTIWILGDSGSTISGYTTNGTDGQVDTISGQGSFYKFELPKQTASFTEDLSVNTDAQSVGFTPTITLSLPKLDQALRNVFFELVKQNETYVILLDANGRYWLVGPENGLTADSGSLQTGQVFNDLNGVNALTLGGFEPNPSNQIQDGGNIANIFTGISWSA